MVAAPDPRESCPCKDTVDDGNPNEKCKQKVTNIQGEKNIGVLEQIVHPSV